jgi:plasmid stabilization system protein ParE
MTLPVVLRREARAEFDEAFDWYEQKRAGLGVEFAEQVQAVFDRISAMPELHAMVYKDVRKALVRRFPYSVFYRVRPGKVVVLAVFHGKRDPNVWKSRA